VEKKSERNIYLLLCIIFCIPLFFINVKSSHDWGDDFAQYILQAKNIVEHKTQTETGYVYDESLSVVAPPAYPAGFPLMLAGIYAWKGNSIHAFTYFITLILFFLCITLFIFLQKFFSGLASLLLVLIFAYNPWTLGCKLEVLSDLPFAFFLLLTVMLYAFGKNSRINYILTGIVCGITLSIRGVGIVFILAVIIHQAYQAFLQIRSGKTSRQHVEKLLIVVGSAAFVYFLLNYIIVKVPTGRFLEFYSSPYKKNTLGDVIIRNLNYYTAVFEEYFNPWVKKWSFVPYVSKAFGLVLVLIGMFYSLLHKRTFIDLLTWIYILLFIFYPYSFGGFRFILPVFPFLLYYMVIGLSRINISVPAGRKILILIGGIVVLLQYKPYIIKLIEERNNVLSGPQEKSSVEAFQYITGNVPESSIIIFTKPKALTLYTNRKTFSTVYGQSADDVKYMIQRLHAEYLLLHNDRDMHDESMENYLSKNQDAVQLAWKNDKFSLYKTR